MDGPLNIVRYKAIVNTLNQNVSKIEHLIFQKYAQFLSFTKYNDFFWKL